MWKASDRLSKLQVLKLHKSINTRDLERINKLLANGLQGLVNIADPKDGSTSIHLAACINDEEIIRILLEAGADCNAVDNNGRTAFMRAAECGHMEALACLFEVCDYPNLIAKDGDGRNILFYCLHSTKRHQVCLELSISHGANVHAVRENGKSLLYEACEKNLVDILELLLNAGVNVDERNEGSGETTLHIACKLGLTECARLLLRHGSNPNLKDNNNVQCAHKAAQNCHLEILILLSAYGGDLGTVNDNNDTPLHLAALKGNVAVCKFLGQRGCPTNIKNSSGCTARSLAASKGHKLAVKAIKKAEKLKGTKPGTQLYLLKFYDWLIENKDMIKSNVIVHDPELTGKVETGEMLSILLTHKSPLESETLLPILETHDKSKGYISYDLFFSGKKFINKSFLTARSRKSAKQKGRRQKGKTKVAVPICTNVADTRFIKNIRPCPNYIEKQELVSDQTRFDRDRQPIHQIEDDSYWYCHQSDPTYVHINEVVKSGDKFTLKGAIEKGYDINEKNKFYKTPLMIACLDGNYELVHYLIECGALINATDNFKWTPLHFACHAGQKSIVELLLRRGANIDAPTLNGGTPLMRGIESSNIEVVQFLIEKGAKVHLETKRGLKALDIAKSYSDPRIIKMIEKRVSEVPPPIVQRKRKFSPVKKNPKRTSHKGIPILPNIKPTYPQIGDMTQSDKNSLVDDAGQENKIEAPVKFHVKKAWMPQPSTRDLLAGKQKKRETFGYKIDFHDYEPPFQSHVNELANRISVAT